MATSSTRNSSFTQQYDNTTGENAAHKIGGDLENAMNQYDNQLLTNPLAAVASANRIRRLSAYLDAFNSGGDLGWHKVIQKNKIRFLNRNCCD